MQLYREPRTTDNCWRRPTIVSEIAATERGFRPSSHQTGARLRRNLCATCRATAPASPSRSLPGIVAGSKHMCQHKVHWPSPGDPYLHNRFVESLEQLATLLFTIPADRTRVFIAVAPWAVKSWRACLGDLDQQTALCRTSCGSRAGATPSSWSSSAGNATLARCVRPSTPPCPRRRRRRPRRPTQTLSRRKPSSTASRLSSATWPPPRAPGSRGRRPATQASPRSLSMSTVCRTRPSRTSTSPATTSRSLRLPTAS
jgi:hypothetical protein